MLFCIGSICVWFEHNKLLLACAIVEINIGFDAKPLAVVWLYVVPLNVIRKYAVFAGCLILIKIIIIFFPVKKEWNEDLFYPVDVRPGWTAFSITVTVGCPLNEKRCLIECSDTKK